jgi:hypothetical protein
MQASNVKDPTTTAVLRERIKDIALYIPLWIVGTIIL